MFKKGILIIAYYALSSKFTFENNRKRKAITCSMCKYMKLHLYKLSRYSIKVILNFK